MTIAAVADAGPLIHLAEIDSLELLSAFDRLSVPGAVYREVEVGGVPAGLPDLSYRLVDPEVDGNRTEKLDPGERAALAVARDRDAVLLTDDLAARDAAADLGVEVHGSIGTIAFGYAQGLLDRVEAATLMRALQRETSLYVTETVVEQGIARLDEG